MRIDTIIRSQGDTVRVPVVLRDRNQLTLPERVAQRLGVRAGSRLLLEIREQGALEVTLRPLRESYAGIAPGAWGNDPVRYVREERASWHEEPDPAGTASDGTPYLTFEESRRAHPGIDLTRQRYDAEPWLRWPACEICGRRLARLHEHAAKHRDGLLDATGEHTDAPQRERSRARVAKYVATRKRQQRTSGRR
jgi:bifunctional DNA-binding transcriptional regulator/antitoxin component of YhaV-PrlF toxin-antitoxin module